MGDNTINDFSAFTFHKNNDTVIHLFAGRPIFNQLVHHLDQVVPEIQATDICHPIHSCLFQLDTNLFFKDSLDLRFHNAQRLCGCVKRFETFFDVFIPRVKKLYGNNRFKITISFNISIYWRRAGGLNNSFEVGKKVELKPVKDLGIPYNLNNDSTKCYF